jgi:hypothetical protein
MSTIPQRKLYDKLKRRFKRATKLRFNITECVITWYSEDFGSIEKAAEKLGIEADRLKEIIKLVESDRADLITDEECQKITNAFFDLFSPMFQYEIKKNDGFFELAA